MPRRAAFSFAILGAIALAALALIPSPYWIVAPGQAIELSRWVAVEGFAPPPERFFLTDVTVQRASLLGLAARLWPGVALVRQDALLPPGESHRGYDLLMVEAMTQSQRVAALVAERAAGYAVPMPAQQTLVEGILANSKAGALLRSGDALQRVAGRPIGSLRDVERALAAHAADRSVEVVVERSGRTLRLLVPTVATASGPRFGIEVEQILAMPLLPVPVHFSLANVSGSSGGLMFALQIYGALRAERLRGATTIAGTGTLRPDGSVQPIEGALQKLIAARRAGASVFLVPRRNYPDVARERGLRVIPVDSFRGALAALAAGQSTPDRI
jgi:PDZ domain-containing protein